VKDEKEDGRVVWERRRRKEMERVLSRERKRK